MSGVTTAEPVVALALSGVRRSFGGVRAVDVGQMHIPDGKLTALIGPNGAGKTTLFNIVTGFERADAGRWSFYGRDITGMDSWRVARAGLVRTFQLTRVLAEMTVLDNLRLAAAGQRGERLSLALWPAAWRKQERANQERAEALLERFRLADKRHHPAAQLSGGQRRLLEVARALMTQPRMLLLDEPLAGVNPALREDVMAHLVALRDDGLTILFIEHDMDAVMGISDHVICLATGTPIAAGTPAQVAATPAVIDAYLGVSTSAPSGARTAAPSGAPAAAASRASTQVATRPQAPAGGPDGDPVLSADGLVSGYNSDRPILQGVSAHVGPGEIVAIIGANGAGKSTLLKAVAGAIPATAGTVRLGQRDVTKLAMHQRVALGLGYVPQSRNVFPSLTVEENLRMGIYLRPREWQRSRDRVLAMFPALRDRLATPAGALSGGQRQSLALARALMPVPTVLLLDEPSAGLSPVAQEEAFEHVCAAAQSGVSVLIVEQNARQCLAISHRGYVLEQGRVALTGTGADLLADPRVVELYLGSTHQRPPENRADRLAPPLHS
ncbi:MAG TPA: ATP-binding cassette domain-containing protein [Micromonosporaceae bacterium]|nr:ATP-binding cassette domain-containing protein [Micromonosporaceae bacterium]